MKKKIVFGSLVAIFLMAMLPSANAVESSTIKETMKSQVPIITPDIDIEELKIKTQDGPEPTFFLIFILHQILNILRIIKFGLPLILIYLIIKAMSGNTTGITR